MKDKVTETRYDSENFLDLFITVLTYNVDKYGFSFEFEVFQTVKNCLFLSGCFPFFIWYKS